MEPVETVSVTETTVGCDGGVGPLGHPLVYLTLERDGSIDCPYCGRRFVHRAMALRSGEAPHSLASHR